MLRGRTLAAVLLLLPAAALAQTRTRAECEAAHPAAWGRAGKDVVLDLGAGDGKIAIAAARSFGARAVGIEYDAEMARLADCLVRAEGATDRVRIVQGDIFKEGFGDATVVTMYLLPHLNLCVRHRLLAMEPGTRVVSHQYTMKDWEPDQSVQIQGRHVHSWVVPARVDGLWDFDDSQGMKLELDLRQTFAALTGEIVRGDVRQALHSATLRGRELRFAFEEAGVSVKFSGTVRGDTVTGVLSRGSAARTAVGRLRGALRPAPWAERMEGCQQFYERQPASSPTIR